MSVFSTGTKTQHFKHFAAVLLLCAAVFASVRAGRAVIGPLTATLRNGMRTVPLSETPPTETVFPQPRAIDWEGVVFGVLAGGEGLAVKRSGSGELFQAYFAQGQTASVSEGPIHITGHWTGISCAYEETVFKRTCTPTVDIDALEILPVALQ